MPNYAKVVAKIKSATSLNEISQIVSAYSANATLRDVTEARVGFE